ncbi:MAG: hypothetical protein MSC30_16615 [Gaiellaceae bacterium MAG52_C11]|nr:hypothetical protein [Candidatus Gaiellasilicea maunaloa]
MAELDWSGRWRGRWIWDREPGEAYWWRATAAESRFVYLRRSFDVAEPPDSLPIRVTCDSRYVLYANGVPVGRGPVRGEPELLGWDELDLGPHVRAGRNVVVALCVYYGRPGPWWVPAAPLGTLGRGSFCCESAPGSSVELLTDLTWHAAPAPWLPVEGGNMHAFPPEVVDGRLAPAGIHDPDVGDDLWPQAVVLAGRGHGTVLDRPPADPYSTPLRRPIPQLAAVRLEPTLIDSASVRAELDESPVSTWATVERDEEGDRMIIVWDIGRLSLARLELTVAGAGEAGAVVDVVAGEDLRADGLPEPAPRDWAARYLLRGEAGEHVAFFDAVGLRYVGVHHAPGIEILLGAEESTYPGADGAEFDCDDARYTDRWQAAVRTVAVCSTDAFLDCPGREQRAWVADAYVQILVSLVTNPDLRLVRHHLELTARKRTLGGLLHGAAACDFSHIGLTLPEYSLHWIRSLAAYWRYTGDEELVRRLLPVADAALERYELQRGASGLLENFPGWIFLDWAQVDRDTVTATHDALYAAALEAYAQLPGARDVRGLIARTATAFELLWDDEREVYVDAIGERGRSRRISQHTNAAALLAGIVPEQRIAGLIDRIVDPAEHGLGRLVPTATPADVRVGGGLAHDVVPVLQYLPPEDFDAEVDVVAAQPWFCRFLHEALARHGRRDLILESILRWRLQPGHGTLQEFWDAAPGASSRCHGWAASPAYDLTTWILGARPLAPGWETATVDPHLGPLSRASGRIPTPRGWLTVRVADGQIDVEAPEGMQVDVSELAR